MNLLSCILNSHPGWVMLSLELHCYKGIYRKVVTDSPKMAGRDSGPMSFWEKSQSVLEDWMLSSIPLSKIIPQEPYGTKLIQYDMKD